MSQLRLGYLYGLGAYFLWGFFPAYFKLLRPSSAVEVLAHRVLWSALFMMALLTVMRRWRKLGPLLRDPAKLGSVTVAATLLAVNWGTYIYGVNTDRVVETSLGYFITPLVVVLLAVVVMRERLSIGQWAAVTVGAVAVLVLTADYGRPPWIALTLATSFGLYSLAKKRLGLPPTDGLFVESAVLAVPAVAVLGWLTATSGTTVGHVGAGHTFLVVASGVITALPLLMFASAANRIPMVSMGMLQYTAPTLQLALGVFAFHEPMPPARLVGFALVWLALAVFTWDGLRRSRRAVLATQPSAA